MWRWVLALCVASVTSAAIAQQASKPYEPVFGQEGKDSVWVPTTPDVLKAMLDLARVTPKDYVIDLGSGDGRTVIAAARRGARALGIEFNPKLVELSKRLAKEAGVADKTTFVQGDMFETDISEATVLALFMLPHHLHKLAPKFLSLRPGTRIVLNTFAIPDWKADASVLVGGGCSHLCTALLYVVPAKVAGRWRLAEGELTLVQKFQMLTGTLSSGATRKPIVDGRLHGREISFSVGGARYAGRVESDTISGKVTGATAGTWTATRR